MDVREHFWRSVLLFFLTAHAWGAEFFVATSGNDAWSGALAAPNGTMSDGPFATIGRAQSAVRTLKQSGYTDHIQVRLRGGTYTISTPLLFTTADGGVGGQEITYSAYPFESVTIQGGGRISNWTAGGTVGSNTFWHAVLSEVQQGTWWFRELYLGDMRLVRARWPNSGMVDVVSSNAVDTQVTIGGTAPGGNLAGQNAEIVIYHPWMISREIVVSSTTSGGYENYTVLNFNTPAGVYATESWHWGFGDVQPGRNAYLEHAYAFLDEAYEWFLHRGTGQLTIVLPNGQNPNSLDIIAPRTTKFVVMQGTSAADPVRNIVFEDLSFGYNAFQLPPDGYSAVQAGHYADLLNFNGWYTKVLPGAMEFVYTDNVRLYGVRLAHTGAGGVAFGVGCRNNVIAGCELYDTGGTGISIGWEGETARFFAADWANSVDVPYNNRIICNQIHHFGQMYKDTVGIWAGYTDSTEIGYNEISQGYYSGISIGWNWTTELTSVKNCIAKYNEIHHVMLELTDGGGIYMLGNQPGSRLTANEIHDIVKHPAAEGYSTNGLYFDQGSANWFVENNVVYNVPNDAAHDPIHFNSCCTNASYQLWGAANYFDRSIAGCEGIGGIGNVVVYNAASPPAAVTGITGVAGSVMPYLRRLMVNADELTADDASVYSITLVAAHPDGADQIKDMRAIINIYGENSAYPRGYFAWGVTQDDLTFFDNYGGGGIYIEPYGSAAGGGYWGFHRDYYGSLEYVSPVSCATTVSGVVRQVTWSFTVRPAWGLEGPLAGNDIAGWARSLTADPWGTNWQNFDLDFGVTSPCGVPGAYYPVGDLNKDCRVNFQDLSMFADNWLAGM